MTFAERLLSTRNQRGLTQEKLASMCGLSQSTIASYESGTRLQARNLLRLAKALGVSAHWLESGHGNPQPLQENGTPYKAHFWPFQQVTLEQYQALSATQQQMVENVLWALISGFESEKKS